MNAQIKAKNAEMRHIFKKVARQIPANVVHFAIGFVRADGSVRFASSSPDDRLNQYLVTALYNRFVERPDETESVN